MNLSPATRVLSRHNRRTYGFLTSAEAWAFSRACWQYASYPISAGFPSLRTENGLYTVEIIALYKDVGDVADRLSGNGELVSLRSEVSA